MEPIIFVVNSKYSGLSVAAFDTKEKAEAWRAARLEPETWQVETLAMNPTESEE